MQSQQAEQQAIDLAQDWANRTWSEVAAAAAPVETSTITQGLAEATKKLRQKQQPQQNAMRTTPYANAKTKATSPGMRRTNVLRNKNYKQQNKISKKYNNAHRDFNKSYTINISF